MFTTMHGFIMLAIISLSWAQSQENPVSTCGFYFPDGSSTQAPCEKGYYCPLNSDPAFLITPILCPGGSYCPEASCSPIQCECGTMCPPGSASPRQCKAPYFCPAGSSFWTLCPAGYKCAETGMCAPTPCPPGSFTGMCSGHMTCGSCSPGRYCPSFFTSILCPTGAYCPGESMAYTVCPAGSYCPLGSAVPIPCPDGGTSSTGATSVHNCIGGNRRAQSRSFWSGWMGW